ncbi:MAG: glutamyl-tRNA reductase [Deltaproteobacteria bacterium]|nr:glutamyl-tRNA reductase [Deltaproteobacteria bacterium]
MKAKGVFSPEDNFEDHRLFCYGTNHRVAKLSFRETFYLGHEELLSVLPKVSGSHQVSELAVLSTCNRFEMYGVLSDHVPSQRERLDHVCTDLLRHANKTTIPKLSELTPQIYCLTGDDAVSHGFAVASSLDSLVVGETQITGQFKDAFQIARQANTLGPRLHFLSQQALRVAKRIRNQTGISQKVVSIGHAALDLAKRVFGNLSEQQVLIIGAGEIAKTTAKYAKKQVKDIHILNRTLAHAQALVEELGLGYAGSLDALAEKLTSADIVVTGITTAKPIITAELMKDVMMRRRNRPLFIVDIGLPRNVEPECEAFEQVYLFEIDDLRQIVDENLEERKSSFQDAKQIILDSLDLFRAKRRYENFSSTFSEFRQYVYGIVERETTKSTRDFTEEQKISLEMMARSVAEKMTADFVCALKKSEKDEAKREVVNFMQNMMTKSLLGAKRERGVWGGEGKACPERSRRVAPPGEFMEEPAAQFPPNHLLAPSGL